MFVYKSLVRYIITLSLPHLSNSSLPGPPSFSGRPQHRPIPGQWPAPTWTHALRVFIISLLYISDCMGSDYVMLENGHPVTGQWPSSSWTVAIQLLDSAHPVPGEWPSTAWIHTLRIFTSLLYISDCMCSDHVMLEAGHPVPG